VEHTGARGIPIATLAPANYSAIHVFGQRLEGLRQTGVTNPSGGIDRLG